MAPGFIRPHNFRFVINIAKYIDLSRRVYVELLKMDNIEYESRRLNNQFRAYTVAGRVEADGG